MDDEKYVMITKKEYEEYQELLKEKVKNTIKDFNFLNGIDLDKIVNDGSVPSVKVWKTEKLGGKFDG